VAAISLLGSAIVFSASEAYLRSTERYASYQEKNGTPGMAVTPEWLAEPWIYTHAKNGHYVEKKVEYTWEVWSNSEGLTGDWPVPEKPKGEFRIIAVGDSWTEGVGDPEGRGYVGRLARDLAGAKGSRRYRVLNAGVSGSDPVYGLELLRRRLVKYHPDLVLLTINSSDVDDLKRRGGLDRFTPEGNPKRRLPVWTWFFNHSHLVRAFVLDWLHYSWELQSPAERAYATEVAIRDLAGAGIRANQFAAENGFKLLLLFHPHAHEVDQGHYRAELIEVQRRLREERIDFVDVLPDFVAAIHGPAAPEFFWPRDSHATPKGYTIFAKALERELKARRLIR
jgi:lysophospholipase L1-like esterase